MCKHKLVIEPSALNSESVVGDECHIISGAKGGPRFDPSFPLFEVDKLSNLILLCRIHHKLIDDQAEIYTADHLRRMKADHEKWLELKLREEPEPRPVRVRRIKSEIPTRLLVIQSGKELLNLATGCHAMHWGYSDDLDTEETELVGSFIQNVADYGGLAAELEPIEHIRAAKSLHDELESLNGRGLMVFAAKEKQSIEGGFSGPSIWRVLHLSVSRGSDSGIVAITSKNF